MDWHEGRLLRLGLFHRGSGTRTKSKVSKRPHSRPSQAPPASLCSKRDSKQLGDDPSAQSYRVRCGPVGRTDTFSTTPLARSGKDPASCIPRQHPKLGTDLLRDLADPEF